MQLASAQFDDTWFFKYIFDQCKTKFFMHRSPMKLLRKCPLNSAQQIETPPCSQSLLERSEKRFLDLSAGRFLLDIDQLARVRERTMANVVQQSGEPEDHADVRDIALIS